MDTDDTVRQIYNLDELTNYRDTDDEKLFAECGRSTGLGLTCRHEVYLVDALIQDLKTERAQANVESWQHGGEPIYDTLGREVVWVDPSDSFGYWCLDSAVMMMEFRGTMYNLCRLKKCLQDVCFLYAKDSVPGIEPKFVYPFRSWEKGLGLVGVNIEVDENVIEWMAWFNKSVQEDLNRFSDKSVILYNQMGNISPSVKALKRLYFPYHRILPRAQRICVTYWATLMWGMMEYILKQQSYKKILTHQCR